MGFIRQTWTLTRKNVLIVLWRQWFFTIIRAFLAPIIFMFFISYAKNFFVPPADFGIGSSRPLRSFEDALGAASSSRTQVAFVNNGHTGGEISAVISQLSDTVRASGKQVQVLADDADLLTVCRSSLRGASACYAAASFHSSATEGGSTWNYTIRADGSFGTNVYVNDNDNDAEIYVLPFQHAIDSAIAGQSQATLPSSINSYPFTSETAQERDDSIREQYMGTLINILSVAFFIGICGVLYQLTGQMALERELGMSQLIEAMTPNQHVWKTQAARLLSYHLAFDIVYAPGWVVMSLFVARLVFIHTSVAMVLLYHLVAGFALSSFAIMGASLFRKAQLSGITVTIVSIVLAIIAQVTGPSSSGAVAVLSLLFPPMNYTFFLIYMARFERIRQPTNLTQGAPESPWQLPGIVFWIFLIIQIFVFPVLGAVIERSLYGTGSKARKVNFNPEDPSRAIQLSGFSKHYYPSWWRRVFLAKFGKKVPETVRAVNDVSLTALKGQILVLLGANGSGKSTSLDAICGLTQITEGSIEIDGTGGLGFCPQKNVIWDEVTVFEHVSIFNRLKATGQLASKEDIWELLRACDLDHKIHAKSKTLSGGQKRKLQLAMSFTGGSRVVCIDEISSGLDPLSRRKIWDILLQERGARTLLMTTHFLDEADTLSDHIAVLSKGHLKAEGSAVDLKHRFGGGYRAIVSAEEKFVVPSQFSSISHTSSYDHTVYELGGSAEAAKFVVMLEEKGLQQYQVNGPTIEDVFLKLAEEVKELPQSGSTIAPQNELDKTEDSEVLDGGSVQRYTPNKSSNVSAQGSEVASETKIEEPEHLQLLTGQGTGFLRQSWVLFRKRLTIVVRNYLPYFFAVIIPIIAAGLTTFFLQDFDGLSCSPEAAASNPRIANVASINTVDIPTGPPGQVSADALARTFGVDVSAIHLQNNLDDFNQYVRNNYANVTPGGIFVAENAAPLFAYRANWQLYTAVLTQNLLNNYLTGTPIVTSYQEFAVPFAPGAGDTLQLILYFGLAMSAFPGFFALYPTMERLRNVRALHYSNGIRAAPLWLAYLAFDFLFVLLISAIVTIIWTAASGVWYAPGYLFTVFFLYGLTSILLVYVVSLFVTSQLAAFAIAAGGQCCFFLLYFIMYLAIITYAPVDEIDRDVTIGHFTIALITPSGNLLRALLLSLNEFSLLCRDREVAPYPGDITVYGGPILYLIVQAMLLFTGLVWYDSGYKPSFLVRNKNRPTDTEESETLIDDGVLTESRRLDSNPDDSLRVLHLNKTFGRNHAVRDITFGVPKNETFALLGPNGAGKSTTISLIRGDMRPSHGRGGDVLVEDTSIIRHRAAARGYLGVCPQFDAMDSMSCLEHLRFYARARGVPDVEHNVAEIVRAVGLEAFKHRMAAKLSGGNKRKLSLGIALMGNPSVLLLDEPSSGMDAAKGEGAGLSIAQLFRVLEERKEELGFEYYSVSQTTLDQVFLSIVGRHNVEEEGQHREVDGRRWWKRK
ncbi:nod factor export ATP-binding protein I [Aulographum hederae CBS 113979]|uniref:Nod factor export ATP-binding protein I n=1 Tax=Aulographum hederae CBS 113979 TaxID=1176131 RepID=A0A6G1HF08_9PEZI|nr:nod factor export ATP-binding protein I [Aulographum hederae CBS 113979]